MKTVYIVLFVCLYLSHSFTAECQLKDTKLFLVASYKRICADLFNNIRPLLPKEVILKITTIVTNNYLFEKKLKEEDLIDTTHSVFVLYKTLHMFWTLNRKFRTLANEIRIPYLKQVIKKMNNSAHSHIFKIIKPRGTISMDSSIVLSVCSVIQERLTTQLSEISDVKQRLENVRRVEGFQEVFSEYCTCETRFMLLYDCIAMHEVYSTQHKPFVSELLARMNEKDSHSINSIELFIKELTATKRTFARWLSECLSFPEELNNKEEVIQYGMLPFIKRVFFFMGKEQKSMNNRSYTMSTSYAYFEREKIPDSFFEFFKKEGLHIEIVESFELNKQKQFFGVITLL